jgi:hypothetical protein
MAKNSKAELSFSFLGTILALNVDRLIHAKLKIYILVIRMPFYSFGEEAGWLAESHIRARTRQIWGIFDLFSHIRIAMGTHEGGYAAIGTIWSLPALVPINMGRPRPHAGSVIILDTQFYPR